jgi:hypothetical protein
MQGESGSFPLSKMDADVPWGGMFAGDGSIPQIGRRGATIPAFFVAAAVPLGSGVASTRPAGKYLFQRVGTPA